ncbi:hypothetical protein [Afifella marina]|uniref:Uncharacterized protein n=1 Tax=Afifella marina DSM 2698 TaxID=1120955 RepID=A0A1G5ME99_AFIMA|nr:hypothetical protein [Afifella marina]MBK1625510.1 hypothetical protein [Afifella marina DSM 2698]MBK1625540.1 hypothetical protein [Afifella marina]MBK5917336.1 hypothetical protein [Afifella marina]RAI23706.1 hypothetical protein CH311_00010 [Afifella marina DSM 2698]SCZ23525.1 hypothetical protein SAMN03080610_00551 [Afifella marina DSM 2698]
MSDYVLFQMWEPFRVSLIEQHDFYVREARSRLLSRFENIEADADRAANAWLEEGGRWFNPDDDPGRYYEVANDVGIQHYQMLCDMREQTRLSVVAGMYHQWDKQLRDWLVREIQHWHRGDCVPAKVWGGDFIRIVDLLESFGWPVRRADYFKSLDACRLVVNVYKHGEGPSLQDLKRRYPEYLHDPFGGEGSSLSNVALRDHTALRVDDHQFQGFDGAIRAFWGDVPESVFSSSISTVPQWFEKAILEDRKLIDETGAKR